MEVTIRACDPRDAADVADVFFRSVREVTLSEYMAVQVKAWAPQPRTVGPAPEPHAGDLIDSHVHGPARRVVAELDVPPAPVGRSAEQVRCHAVEVRDPPADAKDEGQQPGLWQVGDQMFQLAGGLAGICGRAHLALLTPSRCY